MADDASYKAFLTRANQDPKSGHEAETSSSTSQAHGRFDPSSTLSSSQAIPASLRDLNATYVSDTDAEFEPVIFSYASDTLPGPEDFEKALGAKGAAAGKVEELSVEQFDPRGEYGDVISRVGEAGKGKAEGKVKVFRVQVDGKGIRVEYFIVTVGERSLVGVVAKAVES